MADPRSVMKEYRLLEQKRLAGGLSAAEEARLAQLRDLVGPETGVGLAKPGFDVNAAAAKLRESLLPAGLRNRPPPMPEATPEPEPAPEPLAAPNPLEQEWNAAPFAPLTDRAGLDGDALFDPGSLGEEPPPADPAGWEGAAADPGAEAWDPNAQPYDPNAAAYDPNAQPYDPNAAAYDPNAQPYDPNAAAYDPNAQPYDPNAAAAYDPNAQPYDANAPWDPNAQPYDPNTATHWDAAVQPAWDPNLAAPWGEPAATDAEVEPGSAPAAAEPSWEAEPLQAEPLQSEPTPAAEGSEWDVAATEGAPQAEASEWDAAAVPAEPEPEAVGAAEPGFEIAEPTTAEFAMESEPAAPPEGEWAGAAAPEDGFAALEPEPVAEASATGGLELPFEPDEAGEPAVAAPEEILPFDAAAASAIGPGATPEGWDLGAPSADLAASFPDDAAEFGELAGNEPPTQVDALPMEEAQGLLAPLGAGQELTSEDDAFAQGFQLESNGSFGKGEPQGEPTWSEAAPATDAEDWESAPTVDLGTMAPTGEVPPIDLAPGDATLVGAPTEAPPEPRDSAPVPSPAELDPLEEIDVEEIPIVEGSEFLEELPPEPAKPAAKAAAPIAPPPPPPAPPPAAAAAPSVRIDGLHRVVVHTVEGSVKRGSITDVSLDAASLPLVPQLGAAPEELPTSKVKAIFFMLSPGEKAPAPEGKKVRVTFTDGRQIAGFSPDYSDAGTGFFMIPADTRTNTGRIWVYQAAVRQVAVS
jgi:hypothetical protein